MNQRNNLQCTGCEQSNARGICRVATAVLLISLVLHLPVFAQGPGVVMNYDRPERSESRQLKIAAARDSVRKAFTAYNKSGGMLYTQEAIDKEVDKTVTAALGEPGNIWLGAKIAFPILGDEDYLVGGNIVWNTGKLFKGQDSNGYHFTTPIMASLNPTDVTDVPKDTVAGALQKMLQSSEGVMFDFYPLCFSADTVGASVGANHWLRYLNPKFYAGVGARANTIKDTSRAEPTTEVLTYGKLTIGLNLALPYFETTVPPTIAVEARRNWVLSKETFARFVDPSGFDNAWTWHVSGMIPATVGNLGLMFEGRMANGAFPIWHVGLGYYRNP